MLESANTRHYSRLPNGKGTLPEGMQRYLLTITNLYSG